MKQFLIAVLLVLAPLTSYAESLTGELSVGDTIMYTCTGDGSCPTEDDYWKFHGGSHAWLAKNGNTDCRTCHGQDLRGGTAITDRTRPCAAPDDFFLMPDMSDLVFEIPVYDSSIVTTGTKVGIMAQGTKVACAICHEDVEFTVNGTEYEFDNLRDNISGTEESYNGDICDFEAHDQNHGHTFEDHLELHGCLEDDDDEDEDDEDEDDEDEKDEDEDNGNTPPPDPNVKVYWCEDIQSKHGFIGGVTPGTDCSSCHTNRACEWKN